MLYFTLALFQIGGGEEICFPGHSKTNWTLRYVLPKRFDSFVEMPILRQYSILPTHRWESKFILLWPKWESQMGFIYSDLWLILGLFGSREGTMLTVKGGRGRKCNEFTGEVALTGDLLSALFWNILLPMYVQPTPYFSTTVTLSCICFVLAPD